jgi:hypothetical protein
MSYNTLQSTDHMPKLLSLPDGPEERKTFADKDPRRGHKSQIHHLAHLVNAVTCQLSACLSLNSLLNQSIRYADTSETMSTRTESYHASLNLCRKSLKTFANLVGHQINCSKRFHEPRLEPGAVGHTRTEGGYDSLRVATIECTKILDLLQSVEEERQALEAFDQTRQWQGWPNCDALKYLEDLNDTLLGLRDSGGDSDVGWIMAWKQLVDLGIWLQDGPMIWYD